MSKIITKNLKNLNANKQKDTQDPKTKEIKNLFEALKDSSAGVNNTNFYNPFFSANNFSEKFNKEKENLQTNAQKLVSIISQTSEDFNLSYVKKQTEEEISADTNNKEKILNEKFKWYINIIKSANLSKLGINNNNVLYTLSRLIGGICSTGNEYRAGFCMALGAFIDKFDSEIDYKELLITIGKESYHKKTEISSIKNSFCIGRLAIFNTIITHSKLISGEIIYEIFSTSLNTLELNTNLIVEELCTIEIYNFITLLGKDSFTNLKASNKKSQRILENIFKLWLDFASESNTKNADYYLFNNCIVLLMNNILVDEKNIEKNSLLKVFVGNLIKNNNSKYNIDNTIFNTEKTFKLKIFKEKNENVIKTHNEFDTNPKKASKKPKKIKKKGGEQGENTNKFDQDIPRTHMSWIFNILIVKNAGKHHILLDILGKYIINTVKNESNSNLTYLAKIWNFITDSENVSEFGELSFKSYQILLTKISLIIIEALEMNSVDINNKNLKNIKNKLPEIFDFKFFSTFLNFPGGKAKHSSLNQIISALVRVLKNNFFNLEEQTSQKNYIRLQNYSVEIIKLFNGHGFSPISFKSFFMFLYENLSEDQRIEFVNFIVNSGSNSTEKSEGLENNKNGKINSSNKMDIDNEEANNKTNGNSKVNEDEDDEDSDEDSDDQNDFIEGNYGDESFRTVFYTRINVLKTVIMAKSLLPSDAKEIILKYLVKLYLSNHNSSYQDIITYIEDKLIFFYLNFNSKSSVKSQDNKDRKHSINSQNSMVSNESNLQNEYSLIKGMHKFNKQIFRMIKSKDLSINNPEDDIYDNFKASLKSVENKIKNSQTLNTNDEDNLSKKMKKEFNYAIVKILILVSVLYLKDPDQFEDTIFDLQELLEENDNEKKGKKKEKVVSQDSEDTNKFQKVFTEICLQLVSLGNQTLSEFILRTFRRVSCFMNNDSINVLMDYLKENN